MEYDLWNKRYVEAQLSLVDREKAVEKVSEEIERGFSLIGSTAIEDKL